MIFINVYLIILLFVNKSFHKLCSGYGKKNRCERKLNCENIAYYGYLNLLKWVCFNNINHFTWNEKICAIAALNGHFELLKWLRQRGCSWDSETCANAALGGHLDILQWAYKNGCKLESDACENAIIGGHLLVLQ